MDYSHKHFIGNFTILVCLLFHFPENITRYIIKKQSVDKMWFLNSKKKLCAFHCNRKSTQTFVGIRITYRYILQKFIFFMEMRAKMWLVVIKSVGSC